MLKDLFQVPEQLSPMQRNWLKTVHALPAIKPALGGTVLPEDEALAAEAGAILAHADDTAVTNRGATAP